MNEEKKVEIIMEEERLQSSLHFSKLVFRLVLLFVIAITILWSFFRQYIQILIIAGALLPLLLGSGLHPVLSRRGWERLGAYLVIISFQLILFISPLVLPIILPSLGGGIIILAIMGHQYLGGQNSRWFLGVSVLAFVADFILVNKVVTSWFPPLEGSAEMVIGAAFSAMTMAACIFFIHRFLIERETQFREAHGQRERLQSAVERYVTHLTSVGRGDLSARVVIEEGSQDTNNPILLLGQHLNETTTDMERMVNEIEKQHAYMESMVEKYTTHLEAVTQGNLAVRLTIEENGRGADDPLLILGNHLNQMTAALQEMTSQMRETAGQLASAAAEILAATSQQASGTTEQSSAISQTSVTIDQVKAIVEQSYQKAKDVADKARQVSEFSRKGEQEVVDSITKMNWIRDRVSGIAENILALSEQTQKIGEIIATVNDIASQSNLLALNASVEAARAGEHGKGFNVVAVEVRNLAEQSKQATSQVKSILEEIQKATNAAVMATEEGSKGVEEGVGQTRQTVEIIEQMAENANQNAKSAQQIAASAQQQATGMEQISLAMQNINQATMQNLTSNRQTEKAAQGLSSLAQQMEALVARYQL